MAKGSQSSNKGVLLPGDSGFRTLAGSTSQDGVQRPVRSGAERLPLTGGKAVATLTDVAIVEHTQTEHGTNGAEPDLTLTERAAGKVRGMMEMEPAGTAEVLR